MALKFNVKQEAAVLAALLHDYARELKGLQLMELADKAGWPINFVEKDAPLLLHGPVGAYLAAKEFKITDESILHAVRYHTTGSARMDKLAKIIYIADMLEPGRIFTGVEELRGIAYANLDLGLLKCLEHTIFYILDKGRLLHPLTVEARNRLIHDKPKRER